jgi:hypothetical protein
MEAIELKTSVSYKNFDSCYPYLITIDIISEPTNSDAVGKPVKHCKFCDGFPWKRTTTKIKQEKAK